MIAVEPTDLSHDVFLGYAAAVAIVRAISGAQMQYQG